MKACAWVIAFVAAAVHLGAQAPDGPIEWPYVGGRQAHTKHSPAAQITRENVGQLRIAWQWDPNEMPMPELGIRPSSFQATPIMIDNVLYLSTMYNRVAALDAETGLLYVRTSEGTSPNQVCENAGADPNVDVEYSNNCPRGSYATMFRNRPGAAEVAREQARPHPADQAAVRVSGGD